MVDKKHLDESFAILRQKKIDELTEELTRLKNDQDEENRVRLQELANEVTSGMTPQDIRKFGNILMRMTAGLIDDDE